MSSSTAVLCCCCCYWPPLAFPVSKTLAALDDPAACACLDLLSARLIWLPWLAMLARIGYVWLGAPPPMVDCVPHKSDSA